MESYKRYKKVPYPSVQFIPYYDQAAFEGRRVTITKKLERKWHSIVARRADCNIVSYVKSGRTHFRYFLAAYFSYLEEVPVKTSFISNPHKFPYIHFIHFPQFSLADKKVILLVRDPRDVLVSRYFQIKNKGYPYDIDISEFIRSEVFHIRGIIDYMNEWYDARNNFSDFLLARYEDSYFMEAIRFLGIPIDRGAYDFALEYASFDNMKKMEAAGSLDRLGRTKVRRGQKGGYVDYLVGKDLEFVNREMHRLNPIFGYLVD